MGRFIREGFSKAEKNLMLLSHETIVGLRITDKYRKNTFQFKFPKYSALFVVLVRFIFSIPSNNGRRF